MILSLLHLFWELCIAVTFALQFLRPSVRGSGFARLSGMQHFLPARVSNQFETRRSGSVSVHAIGVRQFPSALRFLQGPVRDVLSSCGCSARGEHPCWHHVHSSRRRQCRVATTGHNRHFSIRHWAPSCSDAQRLEARSCAGQRGRSVAVRRAWTRPCAGRQHLSDPSLRIWSVLVH